MTISSSAPTPTPPDDETPFLARTSPPWAARGLAWLIIGLVAVAFVASLVISLPETISSSFVLVPERGGDPVRAPRAGVVAAVRAREGEPVSKGEPAFVIRSVAVGDRSAELGAIETQLAGVAETRTNAQSSQASGRRADQEERAQLTRRLAYLDQKLAEQSGLHNVRTAKFQRDLQIQENEITILHKEIEYKTAHHVIARELAERSERVYTQGILSWLEYNNRQLDAIRLAAELQQLERTVDTNRLKLSQLRAEHDARQIDEKLTVSELEAERRAVQAGLGKLRHAGAAREAEYRELDRRLSEDAARARIRRDALQQELRDSRGSDVLVPAPCDGSVLRLFVRAAGAVVQEGELLAELACGGERLQAEIQVPSSGAGRIAPSQSVKLLYDAFPYQRYGVRYGAVRWVSPASVVIDHTPVFRVLADIHDETVVVKGQRRALRAGMGGRAQIIVGRRSLLSFAFEPLRQLRESFSEGPRR